MTPKRMISSVVKAQDVLQWQGKFPGIAISEQALIGSAIYSCSIFGRIAVVLTAEDFSDATLLYIYKLLNRYFEQGTEWTWQSIADAITSAKHRPVKMQQPITYISNLISHRARTEDIDFHIRQIVGLRVRKIWYAQADLFKQELNDPSQSMLGLLNVLKGLQNIAIQTGMLCMEKELTGSNIETVFLRETEAIRVSEFVGTGIDGLDGSLAWGFHPGQVSIICGRPSSGKSTLRSNIQAYLSSIGVGTLCICREQTLFAELCRFLAIQENIPLQKIIRVREWTKEFEADMRARIDMLQKKNWLIRIIEPLGTYFLSDVKQAVLQARAEGGNPRVVFIDLFAQLDDVNVDSQQPQVISKKVMQTASVAKELDIHICLIVQLSRYGAVKAKLREDIDHREKLKGSGGYEERADLIFMVEREAYNNPNIEDNSIRISVIKQKDGPTLSTLCSFDPITLRITDDLYGKERELDGIDDHVSD